jgi:hypothetical protein
VVIGRGRHRGCHRGRRPRSSWWSSMVKCRVRNLHASSSLSSKLGVVIVDAVSLEGSGRWSCSSHRFQRWVEIVGSRLGSRSSLLGLWV